MSNRINYSSLKQGNLKVIGKIRVISSMDPPSSLPNRPPPLSIHMIEKMTNIQYLKQLEKKYDDFLDKNLQILMLYNVIEDYLEIRDALIVRISNLRRENNLSYYYNKCFMEG